MRRCLSLCCLLIIAGGPVYAQTPDELNDDPEVERKLLQLSEGFEIQLVASEPAVINPVQINFDPQGRLWALCIPRYPQLLPGQDPRDYVVVLEAFDEKGRARKSHVFAEGLIVPTGMAPGDGGVYVGQADKLLHLRDSKGLGKADEKRVLLAGFGTQDTHHTLNSFRWGPDGNLYFNQGIYIKSTVETPYGPRKLWGGCVWQLRPDRLRLEVHDRSILETNTWGHLFDAFGQSFCTTAWPDGIHIVLPDTPLNTSSDRDVVPPLSLTRVADGRHCGATFVSGRHFPQDWQGNLVSGSFASQLIYRYDLRDTGSKFVGKQLEPLVRSRHRKFRPVDVQMGPDGALYVADWYDEVIQHNQIDFRDPRRDHSRGRIWRITAKNRPLVPVPKLTGVPVDAVLDQLKAPEQWTRQQAKRALAERDAKEVAAGIGPWVARLDAKDPDLPRHLLEALWTSQTVDHVDVPLLSRALRLEDARVRAAATRVAGAWHDRLPDPLRLLAVQAADPHPRVRLEAVLALSRVPSAKALQAALVALDQPADPFVDFALRKAAIVLQRNWYPEFQKGGLTFAGNARHLAFALQAIRAADAVPQLAKLVVDNQVSSAHRAEILGLIAELGDAAQLRPVWDEVMARDRLQPTERVALLHALEQAVRQRKVQPAGDLGGSAELVKDADPGVAAAALRLAGAWRQDKLRPEFERLAEDDSPARRRAAVAALVSLGGPAAVQRLEALASAGKSYPVRVQALVGLVSLDVKRAVAQAGRLLHEPVAAGQDPGEVFAAFAERSGGLPALAAALQQERPSADAARVGLRVLNSLGTPAGPLMPILQQAAGVQGAARNVTPQEVQRLLALVKSQGNPHRGEEVFRRPALGCLQCHAIAGAGSRVGPDLGGIGASAQVEYLLESILAPSKVVREGYNTAHVTTSDGKTYSGVVVRENKQELVLRNPSTDELVLPVAQIDERSSAGSLMPQGLDQLLTDGELADLIRFLSELGKPGDFAISHVPTARRWRYLPAMPADFAVLDAVALGKALRSDPRLVWSTAFSMVAGDLPMAAIKPGADAAFAIARCELDVSAAGALTLQLNDVRGLQAWVDGNPVELHERTPLQLTRGMHTLDFRVDLKQRGETAVRCQIADRADASGQGQFQGGK